MNATANNPAQQGKKGATITMERNNPDGSRVVTYMESQQSSSIISMYASRAAAATATRSRRAAVAVSISI